MKLLTTLFIAFIATSSSALAAPTGENGGGRLWYNRPATYWEEFLPLGNGRLGAMVAGSVDQDTVQINEDTFWSNSPYNNVNPQALSHIGEIREDLQAERWEDAQRKSFRYIIADKNGGVTSHGAVYQSAGDVLISNIGKSKGKAVTNYQRWLDLNTATAGVRYTQNGVDYERTVFTSFADDVTVIRLTASKKKALSISIAFAQPAKNKTMYMTRNAIYDKATLITEMSPNEEKTENVPNKLHLTNFIRVIPDGGKLSQGTMAISASSLVAAEASVPTINVKDASAITIVISSATNFVNYHDISADAEQKALALLDAFTKKQTKTPLPTGEEQGERLLALHTQKYQEQFSRVSLSLGSNPAQETKDTEQRIREFKDSNDPGLAALYFQFGRYLLISSSQPGTQPANLQGIWNPCARQYPAWDSKYTANINVEMNYWPAEVCNLSECHEPFISMVRDVSVTGQQSAKEMYGARGWTLHHNTDLWRCTGAVDYASCAVWPTCNAWFCSHLWEHWLYTGDRLYLASVYPILKGAAEFYQDFLYCDNKSGYMVCGPSVSPENTPGKGEYFDEVLQKKQNCAMFSGITMDNQMIFDLLKHTSEAARLLGKDADFAHDLDTLRLQLPPMHIGKYGQLQEWLEDWDREKSSHRHVSHLWGEYPGNMISPWTQPQLFQAVKKSLIGRGDAARGWSMGWKVCLWARLLDGNHALNIMRNQLKLMDPNVTLRTSPDGGTYANMFDSHAPFQIDGNFGCTAGVAEMLAQSYTDCVHLLPALPDEWSEGCVKGLRMRGGFVIENLSWKNGKVVNVSIKSTLGGNLRLRNATTLCRLNGSPLAKAEGQNSNILMQNYDIPQPVISPKAVIPALNLPSTVVYDIPTAAGETVELKAE